MRAARNTLFWWATTVALASAQVSLHAQADVEATERRRITLRPIETTNAVVVHTAAARILLGRADVIERMNKMKHDEPELEQVLLPSLELVKETTRPIEVRLDIHDTTSVPSSDRGPAFWMDQIVADLLLEGRALPFLRGSSTPVIKEVRCAKERPGKKAWPQGTERLVFRTVKGEEIHGIVISLGE